ncbi:MAG TPA: hypothetical protein VJ249_03475 [Candidatus Bathyarchaeia archaeon]|nr:hypothetical protein [Candidatus Bathyarchaeia archaeon]
MSRIDLGDIREEIKQEKSGYIERIIQQFIMQNYAQAKTPDGTFDLETCDKPVLKKIVSELIRLLSETLLREEEISESDKVTKQRKI